MLTVQYIEKFSLFYFGYSLFEEGYVTVAIRYYRMLTYEFHQNTLSYTVISVNSKI